MPGGNSPVFDLRSFVLIGPLDRTQAGRGRGARRPTLRDLFVTGRCSYPFAQTL